MLFAILIILATEMILLGFSRLMTIFFFDTPFQFYAMSVVVLLSVSVIHYKKYQFVMTNAVVLGLQVLQTLRLKILVKQGILEQRSFTEAFLSIYLFIAIIILLRNIIEIIDNEILLSVSKLVKEEFEEVELARWGGEEFLALTRSTVDFSEAIRIAMYQSKQSGKNRTTIIEG